MSGQEINDAEAAAVLKIIEKAVREAVATVGLEGVRMLSMFLSNARTDDCRAKRGQHDV